MDYFPIKSEINSIGGKLTKNNPIQLIISNEKLNQSFFKIIYIYYEFITSV